MRKSIVILLTLALAPIGAGAQTTYDSFRKNARNKLENFRRDAHERLDSFRRKANENYASFLENAWRKVDSKPPVTQPKEETPPIIEVMPEPVKEDKPEYNDNQHQQGQVPIDDEVVVIEEAVVVIEEVVPAPKPDPQPQPVEPIVVAPQPKESFHEFMCYGTPMKVRLGKDHAFKLNGADNMAVSKGWKTLSDQKYDALIADCLALRTKHKLSDWHYLKMLREMARSFLGNTNEAILLMAYVYSQSGYKMRMASAANRLYMCYASRHTIYDKKYYQLDNVNYYVLDGNGESINISEAAFPNETPLSLYITSEPELALNATQSRRLESTKYNDMAFNVKVNKNLINVYDDYPTSEIGGDFMTRWAMYASAPIGKYIKGQLYLDMKKAIAGKSELEAAEMILNWVQTAFTYEYDNKVWGGDRAFFADETLYYPYCDCEDRSILFSRLIRDLLGLDVLLVYYPGHLATAVGFSSDSVKGDYLSLDGKRYVVCDPTYINASVGMTMPDMNNASAKVIKLAH